jgi:iron complex outermembrane recepter protein
MKTNSNKALFAARVSVGSLIASMGLMVPHAALAQGAAAPAEDSETKSEIVVTATRIQTAGFKAPSPMVTVGTEEFQNRAATSITDVLFDLPQVINGTSGIGVSNAG